MTCFFLQSPPPHYDRCAAAYPHPGLPLYSPPTTTTTITCLHHTPTPHHTHTPNVQSEAEVACSLFH
ncbi:hypothetical protein E2C01_076732 [Portunus trituberculatus]|uniref:Uncharacterized protein n=1 Tax=Portunus trituberculatus TaxID=210409 RepID=A0A5B7IKF1_PORTR|nr:hypothetical protein [Portunus trituberculatus]